MDKEVQKILFSEKLGADNVPYASFRNRKSLILGKQLFVARQPQCESMSCQVSVLPVWYCFVEICFISDNHASFSIVCRQHRCYLHSCIRHCDCAVAAQQQLLKPLTLTQWLLHQMRRFQNSFWFDFCCEKSFLLPNRDFETFSVRQLHNRCLNKMPQSEKPSSGIPNGQCW